MSLKNYERLLDYLKAESEKSQQQQQRKSLKPQTVKS